MQVNAWKQLLNDGRTFCLDKVRNLGEREAVLKIKEAVDKDSLTEDRIYFPVLEMLESWIRTGGDPFASARPLPPEVMQLLSTRKATSLDAHAPHAFPPLPQALCAFGLCRLPQPDIRIALCE